MTVAVLTHIHGFLLLTLWSSVATVVVGGFTVGLGLWGIRSGRLRFRDCGWLSAIGALEIGFGIALFVLVFLQ